MTVIKVCPPGTFTVFRYIINELLPFLPSPLPWISVFDGSIGLPHVGEVHQFLVGLKVDLESWPGWINQNVIPFDLVRLNHLG